MRFCKWLPVLFLVALYYGCTAPIPREVKLTINSEPPNAKIYADGKLIGNAPVTLTYPYFVGLDNPGNYYRVIVNQRPVVRDLLQPRSFTAKKDGFEPQTKEIRFTTPYEKSLDPRYSTGAGFFAHQPDFFVPSSYELSFLLESQGAKPQQQQQQQQQQVTIVMPGAGGAAKPCGTLTIITTPAQAEVYIDGTVVGTTPASNLQVEAGAHKIEIQKRGYRTWSRTIQVLPNSPAKFEVELEKI
jgi:hypothetical protein